VSSNLTAPTTFKGVFKEVPNQVAAPNFRRLFVGWQAGNVFAVSMHTESPPVNLKKSWISEHPRFVIGVMLVGCLAPFINKAIHADDPLFVWTAQWIQHHPADFYGFKVNWWVSTVPMWVANWNPPLMSYFLAGMASLFGWNEIVLHLACLGVAFAAATGIYTLAKMWCNRPLLATMVAIFTPAFLVSSTTLMCDVLMLTFWIWALVLWERALAGREQSWWRFAGAGALAGLAVLTKYSAVTLLPLLPILSLLRTRKLGWWLVGLAVPLLMVVGYEWLTAGMYGQGLLSSASYHARTFRAVSDWMARGIIGLAFAGGGLLPLLFFAPWLWRRWLLLSGAVVIFGVLLLTFRFYDNFGLMWAVPNLMKHQDFLLWVILLTAGGLHLLLLVAAEVWRRRDMNSVILALWIVSGFFFAAVLNWTVSARSFLPIVPAAAILLVRRLDATRSSSVVSGGLLWPLIPAAVVTLSLVVADYQLANSARTAAEQITTKYKSAGHQVWFEQHGTFQYYMEKLGSQPIDVERSLLQPGDIVVLPEVGFITHVPPGSVGWMEHFRFTPSSWINLEGGTEGKTAGFYTANYGPVPFVIGQLPSQDYDVVKVFSRVQFKTQPTNPREVQTGDVPRYSTNSVSVEDKTIPPINPEAMKQIQIASQLEADGRFEETIQHYRKALDVDSNNPIALNNLAWILATARPPELRNGEEAVQLATRAVGLTDYRQPVFIGTLAAAYAETGQFPEAVGTACIAEALALVTGQKEIAAKNAELLILYSSGKTAVATPVP
jgi:4-amino-4-deoxy-L-arabinose transferase-like glycosyltransferase